MEEATTAGRFWANLPDDVALDRYRTLVNTVDDGIYQLDPEGRFVAVNEIIVELTGYSREDLIGEFVSLVLDGEDISRIAEEIAHRLTTGESRRENFELTAYTAGGETIPCELRLNLLVEDGEFQGTVGIVRDITERKEAEQIIQEREERKAMERALKESNQRLEEFAYAVSHDLKEPLRMVSNYLTLIERRYGDTLDEDGREFLDVAVDGADRMREMIDGLLEYSRIDTGDVPSDIIDLDDVLEDVRRDLQMKIEERDAGITAEDLPTVRGDGNQLRQLVQNLIDNAIEYSGDDRPKVHVSSRQEGSRWIISVEDEGIGIEPDALDRVFEVFQRLHTQEEHPGTGIGLALCRRIVEHHGGDIWIDSSPGEGTTVSFTLPVARAIEE